MSENRGMASIKLGSRERVELYRLLVGTIQEYAIFLLDSSGNVATWNPGAQNLKGYTDDEIIGRHFSVFYPTKDIRAGKPAYMLELCRTIGHTEDEGWRVRKDGTRFWANVVMTALRGDDGELIGYAKVTRDLTERKNHEEALRHANLQLKRQSMELRELNKSKDEFVSLASHQLRTPASGVKQFLGLLLEGYAGDLSDRQMDYLRRAYDSNNRQIDLINDLLRVAQLDAGKVALKKTKVQIASLVRDVMNEQSDHFQDRHQTATIEVPAGPVVAKIDKPRFRMVLENLIDNASKYTPDGGKIKVTVASGEDGIVIAIADTGVGIDKAAEARLFKKFSRIPNEMSDSVGGSGLGLYWAAKIIRLHDGVITVNSNIGEGTTFIITLPGGR